MNPQMLPTPVMTAANIAASHRIPVDAPDVEPVTFVHPTPNSMFIMPDGKQLQFSQVGRRGHYTTTSAHEVAELMAARKAGNQISVLDAEQEAIAPRVATPAERAREALLANNAGAVAVATEAALAAANGATANQSPEGVEVTVKPVATGGMVNSQSPVAAAAGASVAK